MLPARPTVIGHTSLTHALWRIELISGAITEVAGATAARSTSPAAMLVLPWASASASAAIPASFPQVPAMSVMTVVDVATAVHIKLNASAIAVTSPRRQTRATDVGTRQR